MEKYTFADGSVLPRVGLGTWEAPKGEVGKFIINILYYFNLYFTEH